jgi:hypothetical protein
MRWVVSILAGMTVTFLLTMFGVKSFNRFKPDDDERKTHPLEILSRSDRIDLARLLGEETGRRRPELPKLEDLPQLQIPERVSTGFVQLEVSVDADGRVSDAVVVGATAPREQVEQARAEVLQQGFEPATVDGHAIPSVRTEIVDVTWTSGD